MSVELAPASAILVAEDLLKLWPVKDCGFSKPKNSATWTPVFANICTPIGCAV